MVNTLMSSCCRTCMKNDVKLVHLYESVKIDENSNLQLVQLLMECTAVQVFQEDGLPQSLCQECTKVLHIAYSFRQQVTKSEEQFRKLLKEQVKQEIKIEFDHDYLEAITDSQLDFADSTNDVKINPDENIFNCTQCHKTYTKEKKYIKHLKSHKFSFHCPHCDKTFQKESSLKKHISKHDETAAINNRTINNVLLQDLYTTFTVKDENGDDEQRYQCHRCSHKSFTNINTLLNHILKKHNCHEQEQNSASFMCDTCSKGFRSKHLLRRHLKLHFDEKPYQCTKCQKSYSRSDQLKAHMNTHKDCKPNVCPHCSKAFAQMCSLKDHIRTHTKETPYLCSECGKGFANSSNLRQHMLRHTGVKSHECKLCPKTFCTKGQMTSHMMTHTGAHPYKCDKCGAAFTKPNSLKKHAMIHSGQRPFACDTCLMRFTCKDHLKRHYRIHTGEKPYKCKFCERAFTQSNDLVKHLRSHVGENIYNCSVCGVGFRLQSELKQHYPVHFCGDDPTVKGLLNMNIDHNVPKNVQDSMLPDQTIVPAVRDDKIANIQAEKFMITINSMDGSNMVAINIEPETSSMLKV